VTATKFNEFFVYLPPMVDAWRKFANSASKVIMLRKNRNTGYRNIYLCRNKTRYVN